MAVLLDRDFADELAEYQRQHRRDSRSRKPHRARGPLLTGSNTATIVDWVRVTSTTLDGQGYYPGKIEKWDPNAKTWSDGVDCQVAGPSLDTLTATRYLGRRFGVNSTSGKPVYIVTLGSGTAGGSLTVEYDDNSGAIANVTNLKVNKNDFVLSGASPDAIITWKGFTAQYDDATNSQDSIKILQVGKNNFVLSYPVAGKAKILTKGLTGSYSIVTGITCSTSGISVTTKTVTDQDGLTQTVV